MLGLSETCYKLPKWFKPSRVHLLCCETLALSAPWQCFFFEGDTQLAQYLNVWCEQKAKFNLLCQQLKEGATAPRSAMTHSAPELGWSKDMTEMGLPSVDCDVREKENHNYWLGYNFSWCSLMKKRTFIHLLLWISQNGWNRAAWTILTVMLWRVRQLVNTYNILLISDNETITAVCGIQLNCRAGERRKSQSLQRPERMLLLGFERRGAGHLWAAAAEAIPAVALTHDFTCRPKYLLKRFINNPPVKAKLIQ